MGRYKERETTSTSQNIIPPFIYTFEREDTRTGRIGKGAGYTKQEARDNAWKDLKFGKEPKYRLSSTDREPTISAGGEGAPFSFPIPTSLEEFVVGFIMFFVLIGMVGAGLDYLCKKADEKTDALINKIYPAYETTAERALKQKQKWARWEQFTSNSAKWLATPKNLLSLPGKIIFISSENREIYSVNPNNGKRPINLTRCFSGNIVAAAPSLDGGKIAFIANREGESGIYMMNSNGTQITRVAKTNDGYTNMELTWFSSSVIFVVRKIPPYSKTIWEVEISHSQDSLAMLSMVIPTCEEYNGKWVEEGNRRGGAKFYSCDDPSVSPDRERLAYVKDEYASFDPGIIPAQKASSQIIVKEGTEFTHKDFGAAIVHLGPQAWSPCENKLVFHMSYSGKDRIGILELKESIFGKRLSILWLDVTGNNPAWSPDGKWIAFDNEGTIYAVKVKSGNVRKIVGPKFSGKSGQNPLWVHVP